MIKSNVFTPNQQYILSFKMKKNGGNVSSIDYINDIININTLVVAMDNVLVDENVEDYPNDNEIHEYIISFQTNEMELSDNNLYIRLNMVNSYNYPYNVEFWDIKLIKNKSLTNILVESGDAITIITSNEEELNINDGNPINSIEYSPSPEDLGLSFPDYITEFKTKLFKNGVLLTQELIEGDISLSNKESYMILTDNTKVEFELENTPIENFCAYMSGLEPITVNGNEIAKNTIKDVVFGDSYLEITNLGNSFMVNCTNLTSIDLTGLSGITSIGSGFMNRCTNLTSIDLTPLNKITSISPSFLYLCTSISSIDISIFDIAPKFNSGSFADCTSLRSIQVGGLDYTNKFAGSGIFSNLPTDSNTYIYADTFELGTIFKNNLKPNNPIYPDTWTIVENDMNVDTPMNISLNNEYRLRVRELLEEGVVLENILILKDIDDMVLVDENNKAFKIII